ncbi:MAG: response regulator [Deltaproteobacteria bacterium]|nr:response regulator [Deltaproteobacteria bacterium]
MRTTQLLLVEDNPGDVRLVRETLSDVTDESFNITCASTLRDTLEKIATTKFDAILLDLGLPDGNGIDLVKRVVEATPRTPILVLTGLVDDRIALNALSVGAQDYIVKGILEGQSIARAIHYSVQRKRLLQQLEMLRDIDEAVSSTLDLKDIFGSFLQRIESLFPVAGSCVQRIDKNGALQPLVVKQVEVDELADYPAAADFPRDGNHETCNFAITSFGAGASAPFKRRGWRGAVQIPLAVNHQPWGLVSLFMNGEHDLSDEDSNILRMIISRLTVAVQNAQLYESIVQLAEDLRRSNKVKDEFLSIMSHELRTPLNVMMNCAEILRDGVVGDVTPEQSAILDRLLVQARNQLGLVNGILHVTRMETDKVEINYQEIGLREFLEDLKADYSISFSRERVELVWDIPVDLPRIQTDRDKVRQMLENLINNAIKFTGAGKISVIARVLDSQWIEFKVSDTGSGMPETALATIFEKFQQLDTTATRAHGGVGIGLYLVKQFTDLLKGRIDVTSELGKGSCFTITLPRTPEANATAGLQNRPAV